MTESEQKQKYIILRTKLYKLKNELNELTDYYNEVISSIKEGLTIDKELPQKEQLKQIENNINTIKNELTTEVITRVNNKI